MIARHVITTLALMVYVLPVWANPSERRALVIGNADYRLQAPLRNTINDARDMANTLRKLGFHVTELEDADERAMSRSIGSVWKATGSARPR